MYNTYLLLPFLRSRKYFTNQFYFHEMEKTLKIYSTSKWKNLSNRETGKYVYLNKLEKNRVIFFISLHTFLSIFTKWITFRQCGLFPRSGKYFINALYLLEVDKCLMNCK